MNRPSKTLPNGISCHVQKTSTDGNDIEIGVCVCLPGREKGNPGAGIFHLVNDAHDYVKAIERPKGFNWYVDGSYRDVSGPQTVSPLINGCFGVVFSGKGQITQAKVNMVFKRVCRITAKAKLETE